MQYIDYWRIERLSLLWAAYRIKSWCIQRFPTLVVCVELGYAPILEKGWLSQIMENTNQLHSCNFLLLQFLRFISPKNMKWKNTIIINIQFSVNSHTQKKKNPIWDPKSHNFDLKLLYFPVTVHNPNFLDVLFVKIRWQWWPSPSHGFSPFRAFQKHPKIKPKIVPECFVFRGVGPLNPWLLRSTCKTIVSYLASSYNTRPVRTFSTLRCACFIPSLQNKKRKSSWRF